MKANSLSRRVSAFACDKSQTTLAEPLADVCMYKPRVIRGEQDAWRERDDSPRSLSPTLPTEDNLEGFKRPRLIRIGMIKNDRANYLVNCICGTRAPSRRILVRLPCLWIWANLRNIPLRSTVGILWVVT